MVNRIVSDQFYKFPPADRIVELLDKNIKTNSALFQNYQISRIVSKAFGEQVLLPTAVPIYLAAVMAKFREVTKLDDQTFILISVNVNEALTEVVAQYAKPLPKLISKL